jgi:hypothetical protein
MPLIVEIIKGKLMWVHVSQQFTNIPYIRGLQTKLNGNQTENDRYWQKIIFAKCLKMFSFSHLHSKFAKKCYYDAKHFLLKKINMGIKNAEFWADFNSLMPTLKNVPKKL